MSANQQPAKRPDLKPRITVVGVGGAGGNAINNMIASGLEGVEYIVANTDAQALAMSSAERRIQLGVNLTEGLGAGSKPEIGEAAAQEAVEEIRSAISGSHMVFIAAGMGGGTGTGAAGVIARVAKELDILTVGIVTRPFQFEGSRRARAAEMGIAELKKYVDTLIVIPNQNLFRVATEKTTFSEAFRLADQVRQGRPHQSRFRRRAHGNDGHGQRHDGHRRGRRRTAGNAGGGGGDLQPTAR
jgi:cell division protein FtsZ